MAEVVVRVDERERGRVLKALEEAEDIRLEREELAFGDYILPDGLVVERKSATDFVLSVVDGGLWENIEHLTQAHRQVLYIIEGDPYVTRFHQKALDVHRAFARMVVDHGIAVLPSPDAEQTGVLLVLMTRALAQRAAS